MGLRPWGLGYVLLSNVDPGSRDPNIQALTDEEFLDYGSTLAVLKVSVYILNAYNASARHETLNSKHPKPSPPPQKKKKKPILLTPQYPRHHDESSSGPATAALASVRCWVHNSEDHLQFRV